MVWPFGGEPSLPPGPTRLPDYFPVEPRGCERHAQKLFACVANEATAKARDLEKLGYYKPHFADVATPKVNLPKLEEGADMEALPKEGDNPLDDCRSLIAYYKGCCDRELKKKKNWILTEPYRVQAEYRYSPKDAGAQVSK